MLGLNKSDGIKRKDILWGMSIFIMLKSWNVIEIFKNIWIKKKIQLKAYTWVFYYLRGQSALEHSVNNSREFL